MDEQKQIDTLTAIADTFKSTINVDAVRITCNGESIITDLVNYDVMILESELEKIKPELIDEVPDEAHYEGDENLTESAEKKQEASPIMRELASCFYVIIPMLRYLLLCQYQV